MILLPVYAIPAPETLPTSLLAPATHYSFSVGEWLPNCPCLRARPTVNLPLQAGESLSRARATQDEGSECFGKTLNNGFSRLSPLSSIVA
ncbi:hypothetical protein KSP40_PGU019234 [Platanthera guangdongensis]|uniref:Uncharacterized protein n=1 Tax=Platanthera guangdongensis TaxID=2320717 RepID=A0ABR2LPJ6_9ASPA